MVRALEERIRARRVVVEAVRGFGEAVERVLGPVAVILYGSYARGDFNLWSDIDVLLVVEDGVQLPAKPHRRLDLIEEFLPPNFQVSVVTVSELLRALSRNPVVRSVLSEAVLVYDVLGLERRLREQGFVLRR